MSKTGSMWFDGGTHPGNPGNGGCGAIIKLGEREYSFNEYLGTNVTNNRAEYGGLLLGLRQAQKLGITNLSVFGDSQLVVYQMDGSYSCRHEGLIPLWREAKTLAAEFEAVTYNWVRRSKNQKADAEATKAIQSAGKQAQNKMAEDVPKDESRKGEMKPSKYQENVLYWIREGTGNAACNSVAGSGKSTTLKLAGLELQRQDFSLEEIKIIVFGKQNSLDLIAKFGRGWKQSIQTLHSVGFQVLQSEIGRFRRDERVVNNKYRKIAEDLELIPHGRNQGSLLRRRTISKVEHFLNLINLVRLTLSDLSTQSIREIVNHYNLEGINNYAEVVEAIERVLCLGQEQAIDQHRIDYTDMIWLPVTWALNQKSWFRTYRWVLIDECQDLNACQLELSLMLAGKSGRILSVGDKNQAIMGFAGADNQSYQKIVKRTSAAWRK